MLFCRCYFCGFFVLFLFPFSIIIFFYLFNFLIVLPESLFVCLFVWLHFLQGQSEKHRPGKKSPSRTTIQNSLIIVFNPTKSTPRYLSLPSISLSYLYLSWHRSQSGVKHLETQRQHLYWVKKQNWKVKFEGEELWNRPFSEKKHTAHNRAWAVFK